MRASVGLLFLLLLGFLSCATHLLLLRFHSANGGDRAVYDRGNFCVTVAEPVKYHNLLRFVVLYLLNCDIPENEREARESMFFITLPLLQLQL